MGGKGRNAAAGAAGKQATAEGKAAGKAKAKAKADPAQAKLAQLAALPVAFRDVALRAARQAVRLPTLDQLQVGARGALEGAPLLPRGAGTPALHLVPQAQQLWRASLLAAVPPTHPPHQPATTRPTPT